MYKYFRYLLLSAIVTTVSCKRNKVFEAGSSLKKQYPLLFSSTQSTITDGNIICNMQLRANTIGDTLLFAMLVDNYSDDSLKVDPYELQIATGKSVRSDIAWADLKNVAIAPNSTDTLLFKFAPVNDPALFSRINRTGDMDSVYNIALNFIHKNNGQNVLGEDVRFSLNKATYDNYKAKYAQPRKIILFKFNSPDKIKQQLATNLELLDQERKDSKRTDNVDITAGEMLIQGVSVKMSFYGLDSTLYLNFRLINHGGYTLMVDPSQFIIDVDGKPITPQVRVAADSPPQRSTYTIRTSERLELNLKYPHINPRQFSLLNKAILFPDTKKELFPMPLGFVVDTLR
jgi:hypothetical protein